MRAITTAEQSLAHAAAACYLGFPRGSSRCAVVLAWLMAFILPIQGFAAVVQGVWMPAHRHSVNVTSHLSATSIGLQPLAQVSHDRRDAMRAAQRVFRVDDQPLSSPALIHIAQPDQMHNDLHGLRLPHHHGVGMADVSLNADGADQISIAEAVKHLFDGFDLAPGVLPLAALPGHARPPLAGELTYLPPQPVRTERPPKA